MRQQLWNIRVVYYIVSIEYISSIDIIISKNIAQYTLILSTSTHTYSY